MSTALPSLLRRLYALALGSVAVAVVGAVVVARSAPSVPPPAIVASALLRLRDLLDDPAARAAELGRLHDEAGLNIALYDAQRRLVMTTVEPAPRWMAPGGHFPDGPRPGGPGDPDGPRGPPPDVLRALVDGPEHHGPGGPGPHAPVFSIPLEARSGARFVAVVAFPGISEELRLVLFGAALLLLLGAVSVPFALSLSRPLHELARATEAFGGGNAHARVDHAKAGAFGDLADTFNKMAERVTASMRAEKELLANVSHELRTPLARIRVALDLAAEGDAALARESLSDIEGDLGELERLVEDVLTAARLEANSSGQAPLRRQATPLGSLLADAERRFCTAWPRHVLDVDISALPTVAVDPVLLRRAVDNFLDNAGKYSEPGSHVALRATNGGDKVSIVVEDHGIGIAPEDQPRLFQPFFRAEKSRARSKGGVGLGLALSRRIVEGHGGTVSLASAPGAGTTVTITLPVDLSPTMVEGSDDGGRPSM